ncbi:hypothetical protein B0T11DRAFT_346723 [Plectosphaerella cucumerina]|uniref:LysM domain-containing protein n=1 Tax=Plectosphaerella cucumerina TaxID=40658 RepID=A0A8K0TW32_9PEZI|nr:hypothetical protein B0T11DRAFT_346723 [Plectosphaerella cucumerina]
MITARHLLVLAAAAQAAVGQSSSIPAATATATSSEAPLEIPSEVPETVEEAMRIMRAGPNPRFPFAADTSKACDFWHDDLGELACEEVADYYFLLPEEWNHWNPSVKADCSGWVPGNSYCIAAFADMPGSEPQPQPQPTTTSTTTTAAQTTTRPAPPATTTTQGNGIQTPSPIQEGMVSNCNKFILTTNTDDCYTLSVAHGITIEQAIAWNPAFGPTCGNLWGGHYACIGVISTTPPAPTTTTRATTTTAPGNGIPTPSPIQEGMVSNCNKFIFTKNTDDCYTLSVAHGITVEQVIAYNPAFGPTCGNLWGGHYACIGVVGMTIPPPATTTTTRPPSNGIETPSPVQQEIVSNCNKFDWVNDRETCEVVARRNGITTQQFQTWNPSVGSNCAGLWGKAYACVSIIGFVPTPTQPGNGIATPTPIQREIVSNCNKFDWVNNLENCDIVARRNGITVQQFQTWNPSVGANCGGLWGQAYACVSIIGFTPTPTQPGNGVQTPQPTQQRMVTNCNKFDWVNDRETCDIVARRNGITVQQLQTWNPSVGSNCGGLWGSAWACVGLIRSLRRWQA